MALPRLAAPPRLRPLSQQRIVITGASSGIGLATARLAAAQGAAVMLAARNAEALAEIADELRGQGARVEVQAADVADPAQMEALANAAVQAFGGFDSWVNDAGGVIFGRMEDVPLADQRRLFDVVYWGVVHGTLAAARHLRQEGGAIVNLGSVLADRAIPLQGPYCAAKHAVKAATDTFRMEFEGDGVPISLTLIKPASIDTPIAEHGRELIGGPGTRLPPPLYDPRLVARAILHACTHRVRDLYVGGGGAAISLAATLAPRLTDFVMEAVAGPAQRSSDPGRPERRDNLEAPRADGAEHSSLRSMRARRTSLILDLQLSAPVAALRGGVETAGRLGVTALRRVLPS